MKIILSRKGFDLVHGLYPSPIIDGTPLSIPIPDEQDKVRYSDLTFRGKSYLEIMSDLGMKDYHTQSTCHLDPDLVSDTLPNRTPNHNWIGTMGQMEKAQNHLENQGVGVGAIFLFFGWFKETEYINGKLSYKNNSKYPNGFHLIYGYLEIAEIIKTASQDVASLLARYPWISSHPHFSREDRRNDTSNTIYVGAKNFTLCQNQAGFGILPFSEKLILTKANHPRSHWDLDKLNQFRGLNISYHQLESWRQDYLQSALIGQEFVIEENKRAEEWAIDLITNPI